MPGRKEKTPVNTPEVHFDYLVNQFDEIVFGLRRQSLINLLVIASDGNKQAQKFVDIINALNYQINRRVQTILGIVQGTDDSLRLNIKM
jgi:hypothetical protein